MILEYSEKFPFFAAIFADSENSSLRFALKKIISEFQNNHADILEDWSGNMKYFEDDVELVNKYLSEFL